MLVISAFDKRSGSIDRSFMEVTALTKPQLAALCTGWSGATWRGAHDTMEVVGGAAAGWLSFVTKSPKLALIIGTPLLILNAFMGAHPVVRLFTSIGPGMVAGANAVMVHNWLASGRRRKRDPNLRVAA